MPADNPIRGRPVLLDSNLLLLLVVGLVDQGLVTRFKRTSMYSVRDHTMLADIVDAATCLVTTPHVLAEVSNLGGQLTGRARDAFYLALSNLVLTLLEERTREGKEYVGDRAFARLGVADTAIAHEAESGLFVLSDDLNLCLELQRRSLAAMNFNHLRTHLLARGS